LEKIRFKETEVRRGNMWIFRGQEEDEFENRTKDIKRRITSKEKKLLFAGSIGKGKKKFCNSWQ